jgi:hypothetical protein
VVGSLLQQHRAATVSVCCIPAPDSHDCEPRQPNSILGIVLGLLLVLFDHSAAFAEELHIAHDCPACALVERLAGAIGRNVDMQTGGRLVWLRVLDQVQSDFI